MVARGKSYTSYIQKKDRSHSWLDTGTSINSGGVKQLVCTPDNKIHISRLRVRNMVFNTTYNCVSAISGLSGLLVEETGVS
jgi:hypothetical protein